MSLKPDVAPVGDEVAIATRAAPTARIAVVIPALNEALAIRGVVAAAREQPYEIIVVEDGSTDGTYEAIADLGVRVLRHERRMGKGRSLRDGMAEALRLGFDAVVSMDGDGQHHAVDTPRLIAAHLRDPRALVLCERSRGRDKQPKMRRLANIVADFGVSWGCGQRVLDSQCGHRLYPRALLESIPLPTSDGFAFESEMLIEAARAGFPIASVTIEARYHEGRRPSHFQPLHDVLRITNMLFWKIGKRGFDLPGLYKSLVSKPLRYEV